MKQSHKYYLPKINNLIPLETFIKEVKEESKLIANQVEGKINYISSVADPKKSICIVIGPEGDFTLEELQNIQNKEFLPVSLGPHRLRT